MSNPCLYLPKHDPSMLDLDTTACFLFFQKPDHHLEAHKILFWICDQTVIMSKQYLRIRQFRSVEVRPEQTSTLFTFKIPQNAYDIPIICSGSNINWLTMLTTELMSAQVLDSQVLVRYFSFPNILQYWPRSCNGLPYLV